MNFEKRIRQRIYRAFPDHWFCIQIKHRDIQQLCILDFCLVRGNKTNTVKLLNREHLHVLKHLPVIERCSLLRGNLKKIVTFGTKRCVRYSKHVRCLGCLLLDGFTVISDSCIEKLMPEKKIYDNIIRAI